MKGERSLRFVVAFLALLAACLAVPFGYGAWVLWQTGKPLTTITRMRDLAPFLLDSEDHSPEALGPLLARYNRSECLADAWGRPFIIEPVEVDSGERVFRITSLGSDGERGPCCRGLVAFFEEDAVLQGDVWLQIWKTSR
jgi:hypothetical protein